MVTILLDPARERRLSELAQAQGQDANQFAQPVLEDFVDLSLTAQETVFSESTVASLERTIPELSRIATTLHRNQDKLLETLHAFTHLADMIPNIVEDDSLVLYGILVPVLPGGMPVVPLSRPVDAAAARRRYRDLPRSGVRSADSRSAE